VWRTADSRKKFATSQQTDVAPLLVEALAVEEADRASLTAALEAPTTEVFTGYDALQSTYAAAVRKFTSLVDAQLDAASSGYRGSAVLESAEDVALAPAAVQAEPGLVSRVGSAVKLLIGWTSKEAHLEAKEKAGRELRTGTNASLLQQHEMNTDISLLSTAIKDNIYLLRDGRKVADLYHVKFQKLDSPPSE
jgi:hypothetical protein